MLDLGLGQVVALLFGSALAACGIAGLVPVALRWRRNAFVQGGFARLAPAIASADAYMRPAAPVLSLRPAAIPSDEGESDAALAGAAEELKAQLFAIRLTLSDVTADVMSIHEALNDQGSTDELEAMPDELQQAA